MKAFLLIAAMIVFGTACVTAPAAAQAPEDPPTVEEPDAVLHVKGLACAMCARSLTNELKKLDAVDRVEIELEGDQQARVTFKPETSAKKDDLAGAVERAGFSVQRIEYKESNR